MLNQNKNYGEKETRIDTTSKLNDTAAKVPSTESRDNDVNLDTKVTPKENISETEKYLLAGITKFENINVPFDEAMEEVQQFKLKMFPKETVTVVSKTQPPEADMKEPELRAIDITTVLTSLFKKLSDNNESNEDKIDHSKVNFNESTILKTSSSESSKLLKENAGLHL